ncbi:MAG: DUF1543 domain-containing protein [Chitinophagales bacterium]
MSTSEKTAPFLFAVLIGCTPKGRSIEQHDMLFAAANTIEELTPLIKNFWNRDTAKDTALLVKKLLPGIDSTALQSELQKSLAARDKAHIDAWVRVEYVDGYRVLLSKQAPSGQEEKLYFINLGGYKEGEFEEFHKKLFVVASSPSEAFNCLKQHPFMQEYSPENLGKGGSAHLDDRHKIDFEADDIICLSETLEGDYHIVLEKTQHSSQNQEVIGYVKLD